jgi:non-specific serine/threonine protein kinase/serine/threonine-protein kinase
MPEDPAAGSISEQATLDQAAPSSAGSFGRYKLLQRLGEGGMGEVWLAEQTEPVHRQVALKVIKAGMDSAQVVARFEAERQALALMDHPVIATVFDGGTTPQGRPYFAMEYVKGEPITAYCDRHRLSTRERLGLFTQVCEGVQHAHQKGIIHRDLKPANVLVTIQDDRAVPKIIDFGVAKATAQHLTERSLFTELGVLIGTPEYMSPEQAEMGGLDIDTRTDIYALGVLLYELLTGALPFDRKDLRQAGLSEIQRIIREKEPPRPSTRITQLGPASTEAAKNRHTEPRRLVSELRGDLDWITMRALEKDRTRRYQTANALAADVRRHLNDEPVSAGPPSAAYRAGKFVRRHRFGVIAAATVVLLLAAFAVAMAVQVRRTARERDKAERLATFMVDLFKVSDPGEARGNTITAREVLDKGAERITRELEEDPETKATLMATIGNVYESLGLYGPATPLFEEALRIRTRVLGNKHAEVAASMSDLGWLLLRRGDHQRAEPLLRDALSTRRRLFGNEHPAVGWGLTNLGALLQEKADYAGAEPLYREALAIHRRFPGKDQRDLAASLSNLAGLLQLKGDFAGAEPLLREALGIERRQQGDQHPDVAMDLSNLAALLHEKGNYTEAESLCREAIDVKLRLFGKEHPSVATSLNNLAELLQDKKDYAGAEPRFREALAIERRVLGNEHPTTALTLTRIAGVVAEAGRPVEALPLAQEGVETLRSRLPADHPDRAEGESVLGYCLVKLHRYQEAEPLLLDSYGVLQSQEPQRRRTQRALQGVLALYDAWGKPEEAREWRAKLEVANTAAAQVKAPAVRVSPPGAPPR